MLLGYNLIIYDNKFSMYRNLKLDQCERYKNIYEINKIDPSIKIKTRKYISCTYDNFTIVSKKFKKFCEGEKYEGLEFVLLPNSQGFYWFKIYNTLEIDTEDKGIRFINYDEECEGYEEIIGPFPVHLRVKELISDGFFRSNLCFGSFESKSPLELIGIETKKKLKGAGFNVDCREVHDKYK